MDKETFAQLLSEVEALKPVERLSMSDLLVFPPNINELLNWMMRQKTVRIDDLMAYLGQDEATARSVLDRMVQRGLAEEVHRAAVSDAEPASEEYHVPVQTSRNYRVPHNIWEALDL